MAMDKYLGTWKMDADATENWDAFAAAMNFPADVAQKIKDDKNITVTMTQEGDTFKAVSDHGDRKVDYVFKLGEKFTSKDYGVEAENLYNFDGDGVLVGEHTIMGVTTTSRRTLASPTRMVIESKSKDGVTLKHYFNKC